MAGVSYTWVHTQKKQGLEVSGSVLKGKLSARVGKRARTLFPPVPGLTVLSRIFLPGQLEGLGPGNKRSAVKSGCSLSLCSVSEQPSAIPTWGKEDTFACPSCATSTCPTRKSEREWEHLSIWNLAGRTLLVTSTTWESHLNWIEANK